MIDIEYLIRNQLSSGMTKTCFYCGSPAIIQFSMRKENGKQIKPGHWCCSKRTALCPAIKAKNQKANSERGPDGLTKRERTNLQKFGVTDPMKLESKKKYGATNSFAKPEFKQIMMARYGVTNGSQLLGVGEKISKTLQDRSKEWWQDRSEKQRATAEANGNWTPLGGKWDYRTYRVHAVYVTEKIYKTNKDQINPDDLKRGRSDYHIDHIYSIRDAFLNGVSIEVVSHPCNLRMLKESENKRKNGRSDITLEELYQRIDALKD